MAGSFIAVENSQLSNKKPLTSKAPVRVADHREGIPNSLGGI